MDILAIIATKVVTNVGKESYTSGDQKWNGAEDTLNKYPTDKINNARLNDLIGLISFEFKVSLISRSEVIIDSK